MIALAPGFVVTPNAAPRQPNQKSTQKQTLKVAVRYNGRLYSGQSVRSA